ncbi:retron St85 family RNA-directed DNA polymerase [Mucilaginibacter sp. UYCu711]|uniref:retron St85 family RNA-directed DNA polymerase n=1 Tax=Mucilaginibacter sp. UYCu711 TaxID=3156339 RepID=UPI003D1EE5CB
MDKSDNIRLSFFGLPIIQTIDDFSIITHVSKYTIFQLSKHSQYHYKTYEILKSNGKARLISQPNRRLKGLQSWILFHILNKLKVSSSCKGFERGTSISDNVEPHKFASTVLSIDLSDFFPSVKSNMVYNVFKSVGYNRDIATLMTNICTFNGALPQGGPCSPKLANLILWKLDVRIQGYVGKRGLTYTRYADDLTFSGFNPSKLVQIIPIIKNIINSEKFEVNEKKTRIAGAARAKKVTGLIISNDSFGIGVKKMKIVRAKIHHLTLANQQSNFDLIDEVQGWLAYINSVDRKRLHILNEYISKLSKKNPSTLVAQLNLLKK